MNHLEKILGLLSDREGYVSGQEMSRTLGVTRAAVWKGIESLRRAGYEISSAPRLGYRLERRPNVLSAGTIAAALPEGAVIGRELICLDSVDSTNSYLKALAAQGAAEGTVVLSEEQVGGRGTRGRSFVSPKGEGLYFSVLLRPAQASLRELMWLTSWAAVASCDGIEAACGVRPGIKWTNDLILNSRKMCGMLTATGLAGERGALDYAIVGIGINVSQTQEAFDAAGLGRIATSLAIEGHPVDRNHLAAHMLAALDRMYAQFPQAGEEYLERYRADCLTIGRAVTLENGRRGRASGVDEDFRLIVTYPGGARDYINAGQVSVRGLAGYL